MSSCWSQKGEELLKLNYQLFSVLIVFLLLLENGLSFQPREIDFYHIRACLKGIFVFIREEAFELPFSFSDTDFPLFNFL